MDKAKLVIAMVVVNIIGFLFLFWYVSDLKTYMKENSMAQQSFPDEMKPPAIEPVVSTPVVATLTADSNAGKTVDIFYEGALVRMQVLGKVSEEDADYVAALEQLSQASRKPLTAPSITTANAKTVQARSAGTASAGDHFNKVILKESASNRLADDKLTFAQQVQQLVDRAAVKKSESSKASSSSNVTAANTDDGYIQALDSESKERRNESRIIKVRRGDSLSRIAVRAYGTGYESDYIRIYKANPHLTNPDMIIEGEFLRVPM